MENALNNVEIALLVNSFTLGNFWRVNGKFAKIPSNIW